MPRNSDGQVLQTLLRAASSSGAKVPEIPLPQSTLYGVFGNSYAGALANQAANDPYFGPVAMTMLNDNRIAEMTSYEDQLASSREAQLKAQEVGANAELDRAIIDASPKDYYNVFKRAPSPATGGYGGLEIDPVMAAAANAVKMNAETADTYKTKAEGYKAGAEAGMVTDPKQYGVFQRNPLENPENAVTYNIGMTPKDATDRYSADEGMTVGQQFSLKQLEIAGLLERARISAESGDGEYTANYSPEGNLIGFTKKGTAPPLDYPNPKADAQGAGASAIQGSIAPLANAKALIHELFPGAAVTDWKRDPNSKLGRANPDSWHNRSGAAIDVRPIPGMSFEQFIGRIEKAGYPVIEKRDEVKNPSRHATGKHWHAVIGQRKVNDKVQGTRLANITMIMKRAQERGGTVRQEGNTVIVTAPDGRTATYDATGKRLK